MLTNLFSKSKAYSNIALMAAIACIAAIGSYNWFITPHIRCLEAAQKYANQVDTFTKKGKMLEGRLKVKQLEADKLSKQAAEMQNQFFTAAEAQQFFAGLETAAKQTRCTMTSLNLLADESGEQEKNACAAAGITISRASIGLVGDYFDIVQFLTQLLDRPNWITISPFSLSARQDDSGKLECSLTLAIYVSNDAVDKGADPNE
jgi:Tfp pilus assembly protein PilO